MSLCQNQDNFNVAVDKAIKYQRKKEMNRTVFLIGLVIYVLLASWAVMLASKISNPVERHEHIMFGLLFPPAYIISYYVGRN